MTLDLAIKILLVLSWIPIVVLKIKLREARRHVDYLKQRVCEDVLEKKRPATLIEDLQTVLLLHNHGRIKDLKTYEWSFGDDELHIKFDRNVR